MEQEAYHIYLIKRSGHLFKFLDLESGRLFEAGCLLNFHHFQQSSKFILQQNNKIIIKRCEDVPKQNLNCSLKVSLKY